VIDNILDAARLRPVVIQSLWMRIRGVPAPDAEIEAFADRLNDILHAGGRIRLVQIYTIARRTAESWVEPLVTAELDRVADLVRRRVSLPLDVFPGPA
jgi:hypothetical protein